MMDYLDVLLKILHAKVTRDDSFSIGWSVGFSEGKVSAILKVVFSGENAGLGRNLGTIK